MQISSSQKSSAGLCHPQAHVTDWLAAFAAHPRIGDVDKLKEKYSQFAKLSQTEQATAATASGDVLQVLLDLS